MQQVQVYRSDLWHLVHHRTSRNSGFCNEENLEGRNFLSDERDENTACFRVEGHDNQQQSCPFDESQEVFSDNEKKSLNAPSSLECDWYI